MPPLRGDGEGRWQGDVGAQCHRHALLLRSFFPSQFPHSSALQAPGAPSILLSPISSRYLFPSEALIRSYSITLPFPPFPTRFLLNFAAALCTAASLPCVLLGWCHTSPAPPGPPPPFSRLLLSFLPLAHVPLLSSSQYGRP